MTAAMGAGRGGARPLDRRGGISMNKLLTALAVAAVWPSAWAEDAPVGLADQADRINYSVGFRVGSDFKGKGALNPELLVKGIQDAVAGAEPLISREAMQGALADLQRQAVAEAQAKRQQELDRLIEEGRVFLGENAGKEGVVTLPSGLQYRVIEPGSGDSPGPQDSVTADYRGTLIDGSEFDSSYKRGQPATFALQGVIPGWTEALQLMRPGAHWELFIPPDLAYGDQGKLAGQTLVFDVKLLSVTPATAPKDTP